jgi:hypothetical protein
MAPAFRSAATYCGSPVRMFSVGICRKAGFFDVLRSMVDLEEQLRLAGRAQDAALACGAQAAWLAGCYTEWEEARLRELDDLEGRQQGGQQGQPPAG